MLTILLTAALLSSPPQGQDGDVGVVEAGANAALSSLDPARTLLFHADKVAIGDGRVLDGGWVAVEDGVVKAVGTDLDPQGFATCELSGWLAPGLVSLHGYEGAEGETLDTTRPVMPDVDLSAGFRPARSDFRRSLSAGITTVVLSPRPERLIPGASAVVKTHGGRILRAPALLTISFHRGALTSNEFPTSYAGALEELHRRFSEPKGAIARALSGALPVLLVANERAEIARALDFARRYRLVGALYGSTWAGELVEPIRASGLAVVASPMDPGAHPRAMRSIVALAEAGVRFGFGLDAPERDPNALRLAAALCVREGLDPNLALRALTGDAAAIAGVAGRVGLIAPGRDADFTLWSGDPVDLSSSLEAVYVDGERVVGGDQ